MFEEFLYTLRRGGLKVSLTEWMSLMEALDKGLHRSSFTGFYHLCRCLLVKSEADFDAFDRCFLDYFQGVPAEEEVSQELLRWLLTFGDQVELLEPAELRDRLAERLERALNLSGTDLRKLVNKLRQEMEPIASDPTGYFYADNAGDIYATIRHLRKMRDGIDAAISRGAPLFSALSYTMGAVGCQYGAGSALRLADGGA